MPTPINHSDNLPDVPADPGHILIAQLFFKDAQLRQTSVTLYYKRTEGTLPTQTQMDNMATSVFDNLAGEIDDLMDKDSYVEQLKLRYLNLEDDDIVSFSASDPVPGGLGGILLDPDGELENLPAECALVVRKLTGKNGRANRGRVFLPCVSEAAVHDGFIDFLNRGAAQDILIALAAPITVDDLVFIPVHWNRKDNKLVDITRFAMNQITRTRRDRQFKQTTSVIVA